MAQITNRATLATALTTGLDQIFTNRGKKLKKIWPGFLEKKKIEKGQWVDYDRAGFGFLVKTGEQEQVPYDQIEWGNVFTVTADTYELGFRISRQAMDDMLGGGYGVDLRQIADLGAVTEQFRDSANSTDEDLAAQLVLLSNSATATSKWLGAGRDGVALAGTHTLLKNGAGTFANNMTAAALNYYQLLSAYTTLVTSKSDEGFYSVPPEGVDLIVGTYNQHRAYELVKTTKGKPDSNENTATAMSAIDWNVVVDPWLGPTFKGWALRDKNRAKLYFIDRDGPLFENESDFDVKGMKFSVYQRRKVSFSSPYGYVFNAGA